MKEERVISMKDKKITRKKSLSKRVISISIALSLFTSYMPECVLSDFLDKSIGFVKTVYASTSSLGQSTISAFTINGIDDLEELSAKSAQDYQYATLNFNESITGDGSENFSLGSEDYPFKGKIILSQAGGNTYSVTSALPLFNYICDSVEIEDNSGNPLAISFHRILKGDVQNGVPLFANYVVHDQDYDAVPALNWKFNLSGWEDENNNSATYCYRYAGLFGTVGEGARVTAEFENNASNGTVSSFTNSNIYADEGNAGLICGTIESNAGVTIKLSGTNTNFTVETAWDNTNAGKFVGEMQDSSILTLIVPDQNYFNSMSGSVTGKNYAGGLVGSYNNADFNVISSDDTELLITSNSNVTGTNAAGGLFGYYKNSQPVEFDLTKYSITSGCKVKATNAGAMFGYVEAGNDITVTGGSLTAEGDTVTNFGGVAGAYKSTNGLFTKLEIYNTTFNLKSASTQIYGGAVGVLVNDKNDYIKVDNFTNVYTDNSCKDITTFGGVIGSTEKTNSMIDVGTFTLNTNSNIFNGGGIVGILNKGVLRLSGSTTMTNARAANSKNDNNTIHSEVGNKRGQIVGTRGNALVYAVGTGIDENPSYGNGWSYNRFSGTQFADDIGSWGQVVRVDSDSDVNGTIYFSDTDHTVTIAAAELTMDSADDFVRTALNIQLNDGTSGALCFADTDNTQRDLLASKELKINGTIDLKGTGITGFTRDNGSNDNFTGKLTGENDAKIKLATGEYYGVGTENPSLGSSHGEIFTHNYNALFAKTDEGAVVENITISGYINNASALDGNYVAGLAAEVYGGITLTNVDTEVTINEYTVAKDRKNQYIGGLIANVNTSNDKDIIIQGSDSNTLKLNPTINFSGYYADNIYIGGAISRVSSVIEFEITLDKIDAASQIITNSDVSKDNLYTGGVIGDIALNNKKDTRTVNLSAVKICGAKLSSQNVTKHIGGFLGYAWHNTNVNIAENGLTVTGENTIDEKNTAYIGGLLSRATGHWKVQSNGITIDGMKIESGGQTGFSVLILDGYNDADNGIFLELLNKDSYILTDTVNMKIPKNSGVYDELVAYSGTNILENGKGVISITTDGEYSMDETNSNGYKNVFNTGKVNAYSRYYYNVSAHRTETTGNWALLNWSLNKYACTNIKKHFTLDILPSGTYDLNNISYYPIDIDSDQDLNNVTVKFYGQEIYNTENAGADKRVNDKVDSKASQHYLMHAGLFRNVNKTVNAKNLTLQGNVINNSEYTGALACGTVSSTVKLDGLVLDNLTLKDKTGYLLVNKISTSTGLSFNLSNVSATNYPSTDTPTAAKSLIGDVQGNGINMSFSKIKLDGRKTEGVLPDLNDVYGTSKSIFSSSTLLNKFAVDLSSTGEYNFSHDDDWGTGNRNVTYGAEIISSVENANKQKKYYIDSTYTSEANRLYTRPDADPANDTNAAYESFTSEFLPYVAESGATNPNASSTRELKVNVLSDGIKLGCGTYNHPYEISSSTALVAVSKIMNKNAYPLELSLPKYVSGSDMKVDSERELKSITDKHWCAEKNSCAVFTTSDGDYTYTEGSNTYTWTREMVSLYIASAYYMITNSFTIEESDNYIGLGASPPSDTTGKYAFRGVIVGKNKDITITNASSKKSASNNDNTMGIISMSNGCVIKDLNIEVSISKSDKYNYHFSSPTAYGYNENAPAYGAVINKIMGGDNIIDNVKVSYTYPETANVKAFKISNSQNNKYYATIGGYVGCILNGGLMFRNMTDNHIKNFKVLQVTDQGASINPDYAGETGKIDIASEKLGLASEKDLQFLYINKFVGRVINGYAINETDHYAYSEDGKYAFAPDGVSEGGTRGTENDIVTLHNSRKNYVIPDIKSNTDVKLNFSKKTDSSAYNVVTANDAQSLYILSLITQSGAGCAISEDSAYIYNISYCGKEYKIKTSGEGVLASNYKATHLALYDKVGEAAGSDDYTLSCSDKINDTKCVPYIIHKYTSCYEGASNNKLYPARTLTQRTFFIQLGGSDKTFYLPDSFRGIGFIGFGAKNDAKNDVLKNMNMKIFGLNGNANTIDLNTYLPMYGKNIDIYYNYLGTNDLLYNGPALFNRLYMRDTTSDGYTNAGTFNSDNNYHITKFNLQGYISGITYQNISNVWKKYYNTNAKPNEELNTAFQQNYSAGGIISCGSDKENEKFYNFSDIDLKNLTIESTINAAGFVPFLNSGMLFFNNCNGVNLTIRGGGRVGGFVGTADGASSPSGMHVNANIEGASTTLKNINIEQMYTQDSVKFNFAGGLISSYWGANPQDKNDNHASFIFNNITVTSDNGKGSFIGNVNGNFGYAGGIIGNDERSKGCVIIDCKIEKTNIQARCAGGIFSSNRLTSNDSNDKAYLRIVNCWVSGELDDNGAPKYTISGKDIAGGVIGYNGDQGGTEFNPKFNNTTYQYQIDGCLVKDYAIEIKDKQDNGYSGAGGLLGVNNIACTMVNSKVEGCTITNNGVTQDNRGVGGILGYSALGKSLKGYNIVVMNNKLKSIVSNDTKVGNLIGFANNNSFTLQFAGYSRKGNVQVEGETKTTSIDIGRSTGDAQMPFSNSYLVFADYNNISDTINWDFKKGQTVSGLKGSSTNNVSSMGAAPYATVEDQGKMGANEIITGDSAVLDKSLTSDNNKDKIVAKAIINGNDYSVFDDDAKTKVSNLLNADEDANLKLTTYLTEFGDDSLPEGVDDFPIIAVSQTASITVDLNAYANVVTNTSKNYFASNDSDQYGFDILKCQYIGGDFQIVNDTPSLSYNTTNTNIQMNASNADTNQKDPTFTLIDIKFYDPVYPTDNNVAYHLYIPVVTKNMIKFNFNSSSVSGTSYLKEKYQSFGNKTAENFDNWMTMYVSFEYPKEQLQTLIDNGTGLLWNNEKIVRLSYDMESSAQKTKFVMIDQNNNRDKIYYAEKSVNTDAVTNTVINSKAVDTLIFNKFEDVNGSKSFVPVNLNDLVTVTYAESTDANIQLYEKTIEDDKEACVIAYDNEEKTGDPCYFKKSTGNDEKQYTLTVHGDAIEQYYISAYVDSQNNKDKGYYFNIDTQRTLNGNCKSIIDKKEMSTVLLGDLFTQENFTLTDLNSEDTITVSNNTLTATLSTTVKLMDTPDRLYFKGKFTESGFKLYQGFLLRLNRVNSDGLPDDDQQIHGGPMCTFEQENSSMYVDDNAPFIQSPVHEIDINNIDKGVTEKSIYIIKFPSNDTSLESEFPTRISEGDMSGIKISVSSNLAYNDASNVTYSTKSISERDDYISYYMNNVQKAVVKLNAHSDLDVFDSYGLQSENMSTLGVNSKYLESGVTRERILADIEFDLSQYSDISDADTVIFELTLEQKQDESNGAFRYDKVDINDYLKNITLNSSTSDGSLVPIGEFNKNNNNKIIFTKDQDGKWKAEYQGENVFLDYYEDDKVKLFTGVIAFDIIVGNELKEINGYKYSNYNLILNATLRSKDELFAPNSYGDDHLVYTNAKLNADFVIGNN